ncbi:MAG TPA: adenylate/guanylate cyclase domain-containing protein [Chloroflexia bacterium]|nr:adenylate/guanylate cyclase domain-containing protein [Chloroflexia bacterium]
MNCPNCQTHNPESARFCQNCGTPLPSAQAPRPVEGERKFVTVLFADVVGSTSMGEELDPEQIAEIMNGAFAFMNSAVAKYGGTVARLMGDAILAFFGAPAAHEDDPERAVRAGLEIQSQAREYAQEVKRDYNVDFNVRVGINTGLAVLTMVGDQIKTEYTAMGDTTNLAARLQSAAEPCTVLVSADTYRLVKHAFEVEPRGELTVKGKSAPVVTYEVIAPKETAEKARGLEREGLGSPLVGREGELNILRQRVEQLRGGQGGFVAVVGEAGLGKSRLLAEIHNWTTDDGRRTTNPHSAGSWATPNSGTPQSTSWLEGRAISYGRGISYYPWRAIIRQSVGAHEGDAPETVRRKLVKLCDTECCILPGGDLPFLEAMLAVESEASLRVIEGLQGDALVEQITNAVRGYVCGLAQEQPLVLVFDDLHWADDASLDLLGKVADIVEKYPLLIICLLRPDKDAASWATIEAIHNRLGERLVEVALNPLSGEDSRHLLGNLLYVEQLPESVRNLILARAEGNPFFVEEVIRSLIASDHIVLEAGHWRATESITSVAIPDTLVGVLTSRIDRLPGDTKRVAQVASVVGRLFGYGVLNSICLAAPANERIEGIESHLDKLSNDELLRERSRTPELEYIFKHALTHEAVYNSLLLKRRKEFHQRAGSVLEGVYAGRLDEAAPVLAHHFWQGEEWERAVQYSMQAGRKALGIYALHEALGHYERAIEALSRLLNAPGEQEIDAILGWSASSFQLKPFAEILDRLGHATDIAREIGDKRRLAQVLNWTGRVHMASGHPSQGAPALGESLALADELGDEKLAVFPAYGMAMMKISSDPLRAEAGFRRAFELANKHGDREVAAYALGAMGMVLARLGEFEEAREWLRRASEAVESIDNMAVHADVHLYTAWALLDMGDPQRALKYAETGVKEAIATNSMECICHGFACLGFGHLQSQKLADAVEAFNEAIKRSQFSGAVNVESMGRAGLGMARFFSGQVEVIGEMEAALEQAMEADASNNVALFSDILGQIHATLGQGELAERYLESAIGFYKANGMRPYWERAEKVLSGLHETSGHA